MFYTTLLRHLYLHKYHFTFSVKRKTELPINFVQFLSDGFKKALDDVAKEKNENYKAIRKTVYDFFYTGMHFPHTLVEQPTKKNINIPFITIEHLCYNYLKNYTASPWWIQPEKQLIKTTLEKNDSFSFHFYITGDFNAIWQVPVWFDVLFAWTKNGLGIPNVEVDILQIDELHPTAATNTLFTHNSNEVFAPMLPIKIADLPPTNTQQVQLQLLSPTMLSKYYTAFSFNYLAERILKRALCLQALYCNSNICWTEKNTIGNFQIYKYQKDDTERNAILYNAQHIITHDINVHYSNNYHQSPNAKKTANSSEFEFHGYCGQLNYTDNIKHLGLLSTFVPLLKLAEFINVGDKIRYGNGWIKCYV